MFTGLIEESGTLVGRQAGGEGVQLTIKARNIFDGLSVGDSIAMNGVCLTVVALTGQTFSVQCSPETVHRTTVGDLAVGDLAHLERPLAVGSRLGGHFVQGHVDGTGRLLWRQEEGDSQVVAFSAPPEVAPFLVEKGSVAVDGVSLTVVTCGPDDFTVVLIPHTLTVTRLGRIGTDTPVNLEADILAKYVARAVEAQRLAAHE